MTANQTILELIDKIEPIVFDKTKGMLKPTLEFDLGVLMFEATLYKYSKNSIYKDKTLLLLDNLLEGFHEKELHSGFYEGFEGIFWAVHYLNKCGVIEDMTILDDLLPYLYQSMENDIAANNFDLLHGIINKLQYSIECFGIENETTVKYIDAFIDSLYDKRQENQSGIYWYDEAGEKDALAVNLGYAHGIPSLLVFLVRLKMIGYKAKDQKMEILTEGIIRSLASFKFKFHNVSNYPDVYYPDDDKTKLVPSRLGFCYGDLGIAYALSYAGVGLDRKDLILEAKKITHDVCIRVLSNSEIVCFEDYRFFDTSFCHGISGVLYLLIKINDLLPSELLGKRIQYWEKELIHNLNTQLTVNGNIVFPSYLQPDESNPYSIDDEAFLLGYTGTAMVLLSLYYGKYDWSDLFLLY